MRLPLIFFLLLLSSALTAQSDLIVKKRNNYIFKGENRIFKTRYDSIRNFSEGRAAVFKKGQWGFIDDSGRAVIKQRYAAVSDFHAGLAGVKESTGEGWLILNIDGRKITYSRYSSITYVDSFAVAGPNRMGDGPTDYDVYHYNNGSSGIDNVKSITPRGHGYLFMYHDNACRYDRDVLTAQVYDGSGKSLTPVFLCNDSVLKVNSVISDCSSGKTALLTPDLSVSEWYTHIENEEDGFYIVRSGNFWGAINSSAATVIPATHSSCELAGGNFIVNNHLGARLYDTSGNAIGNLFFSIAYLGQEMFSVRHLTANEYSLMNAQGDTLPGRYQTIHEFHCGLARVTSTDGTKFGYINTNGELTAGWYPRAIVYEPPHSYNDIGGTIFRIFMGIATVGMTEAFQIFDGMGGEQTTPEHYMSDYGSDFKNGYTYYTVRKKSPSPNTYNQELVYYGVIDSTGRIIIPAGYDAVKQVDTFLLLGKNNSVGMWSRSGKQILPVQYTDIDAVGNGFFAVQSQNSTWSTALYRYDGVKGKFLTPFIYSGFKEGGDSTLIVDDWPKHGYMDYNGKLLIRPKYYQALPFHNGSAQVSMDHSGGWFYIDRTGKRIE